MSKAPDLKAARKVPATAKMTGVVVTSEQVKDRSGDLPYDQLEAQGFSGGVGESAVVAIADRVTCVVGAGARSDIDSEVWRRIGVTVARAAKRVKSAAIDPAIAVLDDPESDTAAAGAVAVDLEALAAGLTMGAYEYRELKSDTKGAAKLTTVSIAGSTARKATESIDRGRAVATAVCRARDWVNEPGGSLTPERFANEARKIAAPAGLSIKVLGLPEIRKAKLGGLLGVNRGSELPPRLVEMAWRSGVSGAPTLALVGKGITFDAGGLSIKTSAGMTTMKCDMGGAAAVLGAMSALPDLKPKVNVKAWVPMTDNMLGGDATRVGDVLKIRNGKTVEVLNTDAEGRLILADGLSLATEAKPAAIVDLATLTGAAMVSLGRDYAALMANHDGFADQVKAAAEAAGELVWPLPLPKRYRKLLDSPIADMKNIGGAYGGTLTAGLFLQEFVGEDIPWVHLDIAGPAFSDAPTDWGPKGGTGFGVATLLALISNFTIPG